MSDQERLKQQLLQIPMNELTHQNIITKWFLADKKGNSLSRVMTLKEFFEANSTLMWTYEKFVINHEGELGFMVFSKSWKALKKLLLSLGLTHNDWIMLLPKVGNEYVFDVLNKEQFKQLPFVKICSLRPEGECAKRLMEIFKRKQQRMGGSKTKQIFSKLSIIELLEVSREDVYEGFFTKDSLERQKARSCSEIQSLWNYFKRIQGILRKQGLIEEDGSFMEIQFSKKGFSQKHLEGALSRIGEQAILNFAQPVTLFQSNETRNRSELTFTAKEKFG